MCRNIKPLFNFDPPATDSEIRDASLQYVRKLSGFTKPSEINEEAFNSAVLKISDVTKDLLTALNTNANPKNRDEEAAKRRVRNEKRFPKTLN